MKNKFSILNSRFFYFLRQLLTSENPDKKSAAKKNKIVVENNLRWQDDGGPVVEIVHPVDPTDEKDIL
jgi:hypothetical protein